MVKWCVMVKQASLQPNTVSKFEDAKFALDDFHIQKPFVDSALRNQWSQDVDAYKEAVPPRIPLNLEVLKCFETVQRQYEDRHVVFNNCIAIQPSNPAFPTHSGQTVLMAAPKAGFLEATFLRPVHWVSAFVTSSQRLVLSAYNSDRKLLTETVLQGANLANSDSAIPPNTLLSVAANNIHSVSFRAFDGQFTIDDFSFGF
ncbi:MAG: hypothetical protein ACHBN1_03505 [Heteroscytonema crispum UTEX LB 1556]